MYRNDLVCFYHAEFAASVQDLYISDVDSLVARHGELADFFRKRMDPDNDGTWRHAFDRGMNQLPYHSVMACRWKSSATLLIDPSIISVLTRTNPAVLAGYWQRLKQFGNISARISFEPLSVEVGRLLVTVRKLQTLQECRQYPEILKIITEISPYRDQLGTLGDLFYQIKEYSLGLCYYNAANVIAQIENDDKQIGSTFLMMGLGAYNLGQMKNAISLYATAERVARNIKDFNLLQTVLINKALIVEISMRKSLYREAEEICRSQRNDLGLAYALFNQAGLLFKVEKRYREAISMLKECKVHFERYQESDMVEKTSELLDLALILISARGEEKSTL